MVNGDSKKLQELISIFKSAEERVESVLLETNAESVEDLKIKVDKKLERVNVGLIKDSISWAKTDLPTAYKEGERKIDGSISRRLHIDETAIESSYISLAQNVQHATDHAKNVVNQAIKEAESLHGYGATVGNVKDVIQETLARENGSMIITYNNGAKIPLSAYAQMLARTSRIETANTGSFDRCKELGLDLVRCTKVPGCCPYCFKYEDKVYSISGRDTRFPSLYDTALQNGYNIMHPNCRHEFLPFAAELERPEVVERLIKESNHFEDHDPNSKLFQLYNRNQALQRQWIKESREFHEAKALYGDDMPYQTLGGFRRASRSGSPQYEAIHKRNIDNNQFNRWKGVIGEENMPKTLAEFQDLKYNKGVEFEKLHAFKDYRQDNPTKTTTRQEFERVYQIQKVANKGVVNVPPEKVDVESLSFDDEHINKQRKHSVKKEEAISFIENAKASITVWGGRFERYYSTKGVVYVDKEKMSIRTAYKSSEFTDSTNDIMEVIKKWT